jgi:DNA modification methylase
MALIADILLDSSKPNDVVLDHFLGSGSTLLACERTGRIGRGLEIDPRYVDVALRRLAQATGECPTLVQTRQTFDEVAKERLAKHAGAEGTRP